MEDLNLFLKIMSCLDDYMLLKGKKEINDMEANVELERAGLLEDSASYFSFFNCYFFTYKI